MGKRLQTVAAMACMKSLLMVFNFAFLISGLAVLCAGVWAHLELHRYLQLSDNLSTTAPWVLAATGGLVVVAASLACCCTLKGQPTLLYMYGAFLCVILLLELSVASSVLALRTHLVDSFDRGLNESIVHYRPGARGQSADFDAMQTTLHCCGSHGYADWASLTPPRDVPPSCCRVPDCDTSDTGTIYIEGCYDKVVAFLTDNISMVGAIAVAVATFPLVGAILSCCLAANINKAKYEPMA